MYERRFARSLKGYFYYVVVSRMKKTGYQNEIKSETICKGHKIVWKLRGNAIIMVFIIFSFFLRTIKYAYTLFKTRKMIFSTRAP